MVRHSAVNSVASHILVGSITSLWQRHYLLTRVSREGIENLTRNVGIEYLPEKSMVMP